MMEDKKKAQNALLKELRTERADTVARVQEYLKQQNAIRRQIKKCIKETPRTVPDIARETGLDSQDVLWHIAAMKKYGQVDQKDMDGEYFTYQVSGRK